MPSIGVLRTDWADQADVIRDGQADVGYLRLPGDARGLAVERLYTEPWSAVLPGWTVPH